MCTPSFRRFASLLPVAAVSLLVTTGHSRPALAQGAPPLITIFERAGDVPGGVYGAGLACITDFVGSGIQSVAIGEPGNFPGGNSAFEVVNETGTTVLFADERINNDDTIQMGGSIASIGDAGFNTVGLQDLAVSLAATNPSASSPSTANVYAAPSGAQTIPFEFTIGADLNVGFRVAGLFSDTNNNGRLDFLLSAPFSTNFSSPIVFIVDGASTTSPIADLGDIAGTGFGSSLTSITDLNEDGIRDIVVGAPFPFSTGGGRVLIFSGTEGALLASFSDDTFEGKFGAAVAEIGDLNNDGLSEFVVGAPADNSDGQVPGSFKVLSPQRAQTGGINLNVLCTVAALEDSDELGYSVAGPGDVDGDGSPDFVVGDPGANNNVGRVYVYSYDGSKCSVVAEMNGNGTFDRFGTSLAVRPNPTTQCDINGDGAADIGVGSIGGEPANGRVTFFAGIAPPTPTPTPTATPNIQKAPSKSSFTFKLTRDGNLTAVVTHNVAPSTVSPPPPPRGARLKAGTSSCTVSLFGRRTRADRSQPGPINAHIRNKPLTQKTIRFRASGLRRAQCDFGGKPFSYHMIARTTCNGKSFFSNVVARRTNCGKKPPLKIDRWEQQLSNIR